MIPHFLGECEVLVSASPDFTKFVVGVLGKAHDVSSIYRVYRLRWDAETGGFFRSRAAASYQVKVGAYYPPAYYTHSNDQWKSWLDKPVTFPVTITPQRTYVHTYTAPLKKLCMLAAKATDEDDRLLTIDVHPDGIRTLSHGPHAYALALDKHGAGTPRDGLGSVVVSVDLLKRALKLVKNPARVAVVHTPQGTQLHLGDHKLWTVAREPLDTSAPQSEPLRYPIAAAVRRALPFVCTDAARRNLAQLRIEPREGGVYIYATDGNSMHRESVDCEPLARAVHLPLAIVKRVGKRDRDLVLHVSPDSVRLLVGEVFVTVAASLRTFPPVDTLIDSARRSRADWATLESAAELRSSVNELEVIDEDGEEDGRGYLTVVHEELVEVSAEPYQPGEDWAIFTPQDAQGAQDGPYWSEVYTDKRGTPKPFERCVRFDLARLSESLAAMCGELRLSLDADPNGPLMLQTEDQVHLVMPTN